MKFKLLFIYITMSMLCNYNDSIAKVDKKNKRLKIIQTAKKYLGNKYQYGGTNSKGFDCSGFVMHVYSKNGIQLPRMSKNQYKRAKKIKRTDLKIADLVFFITYGSQVSHVGIFIGENSFIHSPSTDKKIRIDKLDNSYWKPRIAGFATFL